MHVRVMPARLTVLARLRPNSYRLEAPPIVVGGLAVASLAEVICYDTARSAPGQRGLRDWTRAESDVSPSSMLPLM